MIRFLLIFLIFFVQLFAYETIETRNDDIKIKELSFLGDTNELNYNEVLKLYKNKDFKSLPKKSYSFGLENQTYWFVFKISSNNKHLYLRLRSNIIQNSTLYTFLNDKLIKEEQTGGVIPLEKREIKEIPLIFDLSKNQENKLFLLKVSSLSVIPSFVIGDLYEIKKEFDKEFYIFIFLSGMIIFWIFYNLILYFFTKEKTYLYYVIYLSGSYSLVFFLLGYFVYFNDKYLDLVMHFIVFTAQIKLIGLVLFTNNYLDIKKNYPKIAKFNIALLVITYILFFLFPNAIHVSVFLPILIYSLFIFYGFICLKSSFYPSILYLIATGIALLCFIIYLVMNDIGGIIEYSFFTLHLPLFGTTWDAFLLSIAIFYKLKTLKKEKGEYKNMLLLKSNIDSIGQLNANIIHQWKTPLGEIGSINSNLLAKIKYASLDKKELIDSLENISSTLTYISNTINTFQNFYSNQNSSVQTVNIFKTISNVTSFFKESFQEQNIALKININHEFEIKIDKSVLMQILMILVSNAKEQFQEKKISNKYISIDLICEEKNIINICDNAGGIQIQPIEKILDSYVTTKNKSTGLGLYIAKTMANKNNMDLKVKNHKDGACFSVVLPSS